MTRSGIRILFSGLFVLLLLSYTTNAQPAAPAVGRVKADGKSLWVVVQAPVIGGEDTRLEVKPPEVRSVSENAKTPGDYIDKVFESWTPWPGGNKKEPLAAGISPQKDEENTLILGALFRSILPESVILESADGKKFERDKDFRYNEDFGQIANIDSRLGKPGGAMLKVRYQYATQRLDLVQIDRAGKATIKPGQSTMVCPQLPSPDEGNVAIAGVYLAPWERNGSFVIAQEDIYPITAARPVAPINPAALQNARAKLADGKELRIAFVGDSITLGAEAGEWWKGMFADGNKTYATRVVLGLRKSYPKATVTPIHAAKGATTTKAGAGLLADAIGTGKADVVVIAFGMNDAGGPIGKDPTNPPAAYKEDVRALIHTSRDLGAEVILVVPMQPNPWLKNKVAERIVEYRQALLDLSKEENVGMADVYTAWLRQADAGVPPFSQLHNWNNHPGSAGHAVYAETILRFFADEKSAATATQPAPGSAASVPDGGVLLLGGQTLNVGEVNRPNEAAGGGIELTLTPTTQPAGQAGGTMTFIISSAPTTQPGDSATTQPAGGNITLLPSTQPTIGDAGPMTFTISSAPTTQPGEGAATLTINGVTLTGVVTFTGDTTLTIGPPTTRPATQPSADAHEFPPVVQPTEIPGKWKYEIPPLPDLKTILAAAKPNPNIYGLYVWPSEYGTHREAIREVGWKSFRSGGPFDDKAMTAYVQDDVEVLHTMGTKLGKEEGAEAKLLHDFPEAIDKFLARYGPGGSFFADNPAVPVRPVKYVEICNEPNFQYVIPPDGRTPAELEAAREALYAKILPATYALKEKHKDVTFVGFGAGGAAAGDLRFIKNVHAQSPQVAKSYDILSTHPYTQPAGPDMYSLRTWGQYSTASSLKEIRKTLADNGRGDATIWYTEVGWPISQADGGKFKDKPKEVFVTPLLQAAYVVRLYAFAQRLGVERVHIMFATDTDNFNAGFFLPDGKWRMNAKAVATMIKLMPAPKLINVINDGLDGTFVYEFAADARDGAKPQTVIMAWNVPGSKSIGLPVPAEEVIVTDMLGHEQSMTAKDKILSLPIGPCPVYIRAKK